MLREPPCPFGTKVNVVLKAWIFTGLAVFMLYEAWPAAVGDNITVPPLSTAPFRAIKYGEPVPAFCTLQTPLVEPLNGLQLNTLVLVLCAKAGAAKPIKQAANNGRRFVI
jgi:hypothetical protein